MEKGGKIVGWMRMMMIIIEFKRGKKLYPCMLEFGCINIMIYNE